MVREWIREPILLVLGKFALRFQQRQIGICYAYIRMRTYNEQIQNAESDNGTHYKKKTFHDATLSANIHIFLMIYTMQYIDFCIQWACIL